MSNTHYHYKPVEDLVFADDFMFGAVMRNPDICKGVIERLLKIKIDHIVYPELQKSLSPVYASHGVRLDVYVAGSDKVFDVECQSYSISDLGKRSRYYQSMLDMDNLLKGHEYSELKESYVLFICVDDPFGEGLPTYTFDRICQENPSVDLHDETHLVIYNCAAAEKEEDPELQAFLSFVKNNAAQSDFTQELENMVQAKKFEQTFLNEYMAIQLHESDIRRMAREEGREEGRAEGLEKGLAEGEAAALQRTARNMLTMGISPADISKATGLSEEEILALRVIFIDIDDFK